jgi:tRNA 5-methylaminomethyl-2-thiouridine biosynthesis bifunctional protein
MEMLRGASEASDASYWHAQAAWIKPGQMVRAWLAHPSIHNQCGTAIERLLHNGSEWTLIDASGQVVGRADVVVCANAIGVGTLLAPLRDESTARPDAWGQLEALHPMHGTVSHGPHTPGDAPHMPAHPVNGHGSFVPNIPTNNGMRWYAGATFEEKHSACDDLAGQHEANRLRLAQLWPQAAVALDGAFAAGGVEHWTGTRCVTHDRLPLVGPLSLLGQESAPAASLWVCVGMGSRGLSFSALCAQLLVARLCGEPLPVESKLARSLDANRSIRRRALPPPA